MKNFIRKAAVKSPLFSRAFIVGVSGLAGGIKQIGSGGAFYEKTENMGSFSMVRISVDTDYCLHARNHILF